MNKESLSQLLISATTSPRRNLALEQLQTPPFNVDLKVHPGPPEELDSNNTVSVAADKATYLVDLISHATKNPDTYSLIAPLLAEIIRSIDKHQGNFKVISADIRTETNEHQPNLNRDSFVSHGKPKDAGEFQQTLSRMNQTKQKIYRVFMGSQILSYNPKNELPVQVSHAQRVRVKLRPEKLNELTTDRGLDEYIKRFREFYSSQAYSKNGLPSIDFTNLSSGLSLPVLIQGGYVDEVGLDGQNFKLDKIPVRLLKEIIYGVAVGYSPYVLNEIYPGAYDFIIDNWDWLESVVDHVKK